MDNITGSLGVKIESDFSDYYDSLGSQSGHLVYKRYLKDAKSRAASLKYLRSLGINTVGVQAVSQISNFSGIEEVVVYTDPYKHEFAGKKILTLADARQLYPNCLAAQYFRESDGITMKVLQVGSLRYTLYFKNSNPDIIAEGELIKVDTLEPNLNFLFMQPIFSIDYINTAGGTLAIDYNTVQNLGKLSLERLIPKEVVAAEIKKALLAYNKC